MTTAASGVVVKMGDQDVLFRPLNWATLEALQDKLDLVSAMGVGIRKTVFLTPAERDAILDVVHGALVASNDGIERDWVKENLNLGNLEEVMAAVFNTNGFITAPASETGKGEAEAAGSGS